MTKKKYDFSAIERDNDWGEYRKDSKKKTKHREESGNNWKRTLNTDYNSEDDYYENEEFDKGKVSRW